MLDAWRNERTETNFNRMSEQAQRLAERLGKRVTIEVQHNEVRLDPQRFAPLWSTLVHAVRNAVDHGLESPDERQAAAKTVPAKIVLSSRLDGEHVVLEIADDGRGIDWRKVREKAITQGLPHETPADLEAAIFSDGISTKDEASEVSGRGVGMGALKQTCESLQGTLTLHSELGRGTRFSLRLPLSAATTRTAAA
jgi:two-component system, chemotaxis family, sensor kinase CheA